MVVTGPLGERGWAALAEALRLLPPLVPQDPQALQDLQDFGDPEMVNNQEFYHQGFRSFVVSSTGQGPRKLMLDGREEDLKAVFNSIPIGSFWHLEYRTQVPQIRYHRSFNKASEEDWVRLEQYMDMDTEESKPMSMRKMLLAMLVPKLVFLAMILFKSPSEPGQMSSI